MWCGASRRRSSSVHPGSAALEHDDSLPRRAYKLEELTGTDRLPRSVFCPIAHIPMQDPVIAADGFSYEREALARWFVSHDTSPTTNRRMPKAVIPNHALRLTIGELVAAASGA